VRNARPDALEHRVAELELLGEPALLRERGEGSSQLSGHVPGQLFVAVGFVEAFAEDAQSLGVECFEPALELERDDLFVEAFEKVFYRHAISLVGRSGWPDQARWRSTRLAELEGIHKGRLW
jgi:hypothetical protein